MPSSETPKKRDDTVHGPRWVVPGSSGPGDDQPFPGDGEAATPSLIDNWIDA
jgi:hypothetical protein